VHLNTTGIEFGLKSIETELFPTTLVLLAVLVVFVELVLLLVVLLVLPVLLELEFGYCFNGPKEKIV
jgi:hypothetical protein